MNKYTFSNGNVLEMKALQHAEFASEETHCYEAKLYLNGKLFAYVSNDGRGAADDQDPADGVTYQQVRELDQLCSDEMPMWEFDGHSGKQSLEMWCCEAVNFLLAKKDMKRTMRSKILYKDPAKPNSLMVVSYKGLRKLTDRHMEHFKSRHKDVLILNEMDEDEATKIYRETA